MLTASHTTNTRSVFYRNDHYPHSETSNLVNCKTGAPLLTVKQCLQEANSSSDSQEIHRLSKNSNIYCSVNNIRPQVQILMQTNSVHELTLFRAKCPYNPPLVHNLSHIYPDHTLTSYFITEHLKIIFRQHYKENLRRKIFLPSMVSEITRSTSRKAFPPDLNRTSAYI
jgi:hypothetical protein